MLREFDSARHFLYIAMDLIADLHDCMDMHLLPSVTMAAHAAMFFLPHPRGINLAVSYMNIIEVTCEQLGYTDCEV